MVYGWQVSCLGSRHFFKGCCFILRLALTFDSPGKKKKNLRALLGPDPITLITAAGRITPLKCSSRPGFSRSLGLDRERFGKLVPRPQSLEASRIRRPSHSRKGESDLSSAMDGEGRHGFCKKLERARMASGCGNRNRPLPSLRSDYRLGADGEW
jgi:hypothetical protein